MHLNYWAKKGEFLPTSLKLIFVLSLDRIEAANIVNIKALYRYGKHLIFTKIENTGKKEKGIYQWGLN